MTLTLEPQSIRKFSKNKDIYVDSGKITVLLKLLKGYKKQGRKVLIFSQVCDYYLCPSTVSQVFF